MPKLRVAPDLEMFYLMDDFTDPWTKPETVLMLHGLCESTASWYAWVPTLARQFKVVRADMRGFGPSRPRCPRVIGGRWTPSSMTLSH